MSSGPTTIAPGAHIVLVEAKSNSFSDLIAAVNYAKTQPGVAAVSMSWGAGEFSSETGYDSNFLQPGVVFVASLPAMPGHTTRNIQPFRPMSCPWAEQP